MELSPFDHPEWLANQTSTGQLSLLQRLPALG
jgi:hypothetical protein